MITQLEAGEVRVLGALIEKEKTTPDYYPMTVNAIRVACNQKSNRDPVMELTENDVIDLIHSLDKKHYVWQKPSVDSRVPKYAHRLTSLHDFTEGELAVLCVMFLRGPQTVGELRTRTHRMVNFDSLEGVHEVLKHLMDDDFGPFVVQLPRQAGSRESRYMHLFAGKEFPDQLVQGEQSAETRVANGALEQRVSALEMQLEVLKERLERLESKLEREM